MAMLRICTTDGCETKTLGDHCLEHERASAIAPQSSDAEIQRPPQLLNVAVAAGSAV